MDYFKEVAILLNDGHLMSKVDIHFKDQLKAFPASIRHHHSETCGYLRHVYEVMNIAANILENIGFGVSYDSLMRVAFLHDLDKLERYELDPEKPTVKQIKYAESLGIYIEDNDSKSSLSTKIDNKKTGDKKPIQYYRYREKLGVDDSAAVVHICMEIGIKLSKEEVHAICFHHGGWADIARRDSKMSPMAVILHCADLLSAKIYGELKWKFM